MLMTKAVLKIPDMSCGHCVMRIENAIRSAGAEGKADLETKTAVVEFDPGKVSLEEIIKAIERYGYEVKPAEH
ncbi:heavy-metal-associated domain-containing protein [Thermococcus zilligii]|uniref:heavy-metal-associated domain-containing protein n=1 Tax=Thermococcus zilligii TaxID=54076 RepID=UPI001ED95EB1|nr:heavy-metal-associated domain-containing protein [Thermococcus zilligii]